jgi:hypothetical protein
MCSLFGLILNGSTIAKAAVVFLSNIILIFPKNLADFILKYIFYNINNLDFVNTIKPFYIHLFLGIMCFILIFRHTFIYYETLNKQEKEDSFVRSNNKLDYY